MPVSFLMPTFPHRYRRRWYGRPQFYLPTLIVLLAIIFGLFYFGIVRAALKNFVAGHVRQGTSTITQQLARNSFALKEKTYRRKLLEIFVAERIEQHFDKQKIMELYLNRIYFGGGLYGAEAAAR